jgi:hypothetical protein
MAGALPAPIMAAMSGKGTSSVVTRGWRLVRLALHLLQGMLTIAMLYPFYMPARRRTAVKRWSHSLLGMLSVKLHVHGTPPRGHAAPAMLVANHVSWLDIYAIGTVCGQIGNPQMAGDRLVERENRHPVHRTRTAPRHRAHQR